VFRIMQLWADRLPGRFELPGMRAGTVGKRTVMMVRRDWVHMSLEGQGSGVFRKCPYLP